MIVKTGTVHKWILTEPVHITVHVQAQQNILSTYSVSHPVSHIGDSKLSLYLLEVFSFWENCHHTNNYPNNKAQL